MNLKIKSALFLIASALLLMPVHVYAQTPSSSNYSVEESSFSSGSNIDANSASYNAQVAAGNLGVGSAFSSNYGVYAGPINPNEEYLEMVVDVATIDLGTLTDSATSTGVGTFYVRSYLNSSYTVVTISDPPTSENGDVLNGMASTASPSIGTEQFGINLVNNTTPNIGNDPVPDPSATFANGQAATGYDVVDQFRYVQGEVIAENGGAPAWGQTNFTISYMVNISGVTEAGLYSMRHEFVAITTF
jgi:hypothetical protein